MSVVSNVLKLLDSCRGEYISGEDIAKKLNISRTAVWKAISSLKGKGYIIEAVTNKGYRLSSDTDILSTTSIKKYLNSSNKEFDIHIYKSVTSTNNIAKEFATAGANEWLLIIADEQTEGRGRGNKSFFSPSKTGVYVTVLLRPKVSSKEALLITSATAVSVAKAIEDIAGVRTGIKWINDIFIGDRKVAGILTEASLSLENGMLDYVIIGFGINILDPENGFPKELTGIATSVTNKSEADLRSKVIASVLNNFIEYYERLTEKEYLNFYNERLLFRNKSISINRDGRRAEVELLGIDDNFHLKVLNNGKEESIASGEFEVVS